MSLRDEHFIWLDVANELTDVLLYLLVLFVVALFDLQTLQRRDARAVPSKMWRKEEKETSRDKKLQLERGNLRSARLQAIDKERVLIRRGLAATYPISVVCSIE